MTDRTLKDIGRRPLDFNRSMVEEVLPDFYREQYPMLIAMLKSYYEDGEADGGFIAKIHDLYTTRDIAQTNSENLTLIEDELLLGQSYLDGWLNPRQSAQLSNNFYRSKGSLYGIQRFFRSFYGEDPIVEYGKDKVFRVGMDAIGPQSTKFIINDKIYQFWGMLIKVGVPQNDWAEVFKLFAHPAGMYVGSEVLIVAVNSNHIMYQSPRARISTNSQEINIPIATLVSAPIRAVSSVTGIGPVGEVGGSWRYSLDNTVTLLGEAFPTLEPIFSQYQSLQDLTKSSSPTSDEDSDAAGSSMRASNVFETVDQDKDVG